MDIIILGAALPFGPDSLKFKSLGGSETAQLMLGKELAKLGHSVTQITSLPPVGSPDFVASGTIAPDGVRYVEIEAWQRLVSSARTDLLIISRDMRFAGVPHQAKHTVFWAHDLATYSFMAPSLQALSFNIDEVWAVSNWQADQIHSVTGYPRERIIALRNGIVDVRDDTVVTPLFGAPERADKTLIFAARPERGLQALVREGGIMERLPEFKLRVSMYAHFPEHMKPLYDYCQQRIAALPNVEYLGSLSQSQMRAAIAESSAYVYPTMFEETSCILARECIETFTPMLTNEVGALPETLGNCGFFLEDFRIEQFENRYQKPSLEWNSDEYCEAFAKMIRWWHTDAANRYKKTVREAQTARHENKDLYWDGVAKAAVERVGAYIKPTPFSLVRSLIEDGDAIAALHAIEGFEAEGGIPDLTLRYFDYVKSAYHFVDFDDKQMGAYYEAATKHWSAKYPGQHQGDPVGDHMWQQPRHLAVRERIHDLKLPAGSTIFEYGIAEGNLILNLAKFYPQYHFVGCDFDELALEKAREYAAKHNIKNFDCYNTLGDVCKYQKHLYDFVICCEVLEHVRYPWRHLEKLEAFAKPGAQVMLSTPYGGWEAMQWSNFGHDYYRQHIWEFSGDDYREMLAEKKDLLIGQVSTFCNADGRTYGHLCASYVADQKPVFEIDLDRKIRAHNPRQSVTACVIAKDSEATIMNMLGSLWKNVHALHVALDTNTKDNTLYRIQDFAAKYPWIPVKIINVPSIKPGEFGFDDARNASVYDLSTEWFLWLDTDEYLSGGVAKYLRSNALDSYAIHQHHFSVEPRGAAAQIDRPSRLCRSGMKFYGKVHEHAEVRYNEGPGYSILVPDADIGHVGYVNEGIRRARFERNFPFLEWDRQLNPDRKLGAYLWFRDILHRMRYAMEAQNHAVVYAMANEAIAFYNTNCEQIVSFGMGAEAALAYLGEAYRVLGRGRQVDIVVAVDGQPVKFGGLVDSVDQVLMPIRKLLDGELQKSSGKYWR